MRGPLSATRRLLCAPCIPISEMYPLLLLPWKCMVAGTVCGILVPGPPTDAQMYMWLFKSLE